MSVQTPKRTTRHRYTPRQYGRRTLRLSSYDYTQAGAYFVTICTQHRQRLFGNIVDGAMVLSEAGRMVQTVWDEIPAHYPGIDIDAFIVMPDHVHGIIIIKDRGDLEQRPREAAATGDGDDSEDRGNPGDRDDSGHINRAPQSCYGTAPVPSPVKDREDLERRPRGDAATGDRGDSEDWRDSKDRDDSKDQANPEDAATGQPSYWPFPEESENPAGSPEENRLSLPDIMHRFKTMTTKRYTDGVKQHGWPPFPGKLWLRSYWERIIRDEEALQRVRAYIRNNPAKWKG